MSSGAAGRSGPGALWRGASRRLFSRAFLDLGGGPEDAIVLAGSGRSGTTWLAEVINHDNAYRYLFEPFHPDRSGRMAGRPPRLYARPGTRPAGLAEATGSVLSGRTRDRWTDQYNRKPVARRRLVKEVWANLLLGWLLEAYPGLRVALVVRHPFAVAESQLRSRWEWHVDPGHLLAQPDLMRDHLEPFRELMEGTTDPFERCVLTWCAETLVPLRQLAPGRGSLAFYEDLRADPAVRLPSLFAAVGRPWSDRALRAVGRPSPVSAPLGSGRGSPERPDAWRERISGDRVRRAAEIVAAFGLDRLYGVDPMPRMAAEELPAAFSTP